MRSIRTELWKAIHNPMFYMALFIGTSVAMINVVENAAIVARFTKSMTDSAVSEDGLSKSCIGFSLFIHWIAVNPASFGARAFYFIWPILAALPYGWSYFAERRTGVYNLLVCRSNVTTYYFAKYCAVFVSGGLAVSVPVLLNLLVNALVCPYALPKAIVPISLVNDGYFLSELYYTIPWAYALIWCGMEFLIGGAAACICLITGTWLRYQALVILTPFVIFTLLDAAFAALGGSMDIKANLSPLALAAAAGARPNPEWAVFSVLAMMVMIGFAGGYWQVIRHELV